MRSKSRLIICLACSVLASCSRDGLSDLREFVKNAYADRKPSIEPIPEIKPYEPFAYAAAKLPDPFVPYSARLAQKQAGPRPDMNRRKEPLEEYPLDSLKMVGTISRGNQVWAVVQAPDGTVYRVHAGNHMGQNYGTVKKVTEDKISLIELVPGSMGDWVERDASLAIPE